MFQWKSMLRLSLAVLACVLFARISDAQDQKAEVSGAADVAHDKADHSHAEHGHHIDPANSNLSESGPDPAEWRSEMSIATAIVFGVLMFFLTAYAWRPIAEGLEKREKSIATNIRKAEEAAAGAAAKLAEYEKKLAEAAQEAQRIVAEARKDAETAGQRLLATAQEEASRQRERAVAEIDSAKRVALNELAQQSTEVAVTLAQRIVGREVKANDHQGMIQDMLGKLPSKN